MLSLKKLSTIGVFFVPEMFQEKLHHVVVSNVDAKVKSDGSNFGMAIGLTNMHYIFRITPL